MNLDLLKKVSEAFGPSGFEREVQRIVKKEGEIYADEVISDRLGSLAFKIGSTGPKLMFSAHVDEVGFMVSRIEDTGMLRIGKIGYPIEHFHLSHEILIKSIQNNKKYIGLIEAKPFFETNEFSNELKIQKYWVDIGCDSKEEVEELGIQVGDPAIPYSNFKLLEPLKKKRAISRNFDDRIGTYILLEVMKFIKENNIKLKNQVYFVSSTQEEVGSRGAKTMANLIQPDIEFAIDIIPSNDFPDYPHQNKQSIGKGTVIQAYDIFLIPNPELRKYVMDLAKRESILWQPGYLSGGGTDASTIHVSNIGIPSINLSIPLRYYHSHHSLIDFDDVRNTEKLIIEIIKDFTDEKLQKIIEI